MLKEKKIELVIFDMDGVMFDTERLTIKAWKEALIKSGYKVDENALERIIGSNLKLTGKIMSDHYGSDFRLDDIIRESEIIIKDFIDKNGVPLKEGLFELLDFLKNQKVKIALATSTARKKAENNLTLAGVIKYFNVITCGDEVKESKPEPEIFLKSAEKSGVPPEKCVVLEDSRNGIIAAFKAGMFPVMIPDLIKPDKEIEKMLHKKFDSLFDVKKYFEA
jgi:HAD superfamily hydrolase (TIGR01509 family)